MNRCTRVAAIALASLACQEQGVRLGSEELCVLDPRLAAAQERPGSPQLSSCATIGENRLVNGTFEAPSVGSVRGCADDFCQVPGTEVLGWRTTSEGQLIELWTDGYADVPSPEGQQFAELDASTPDTLFQDLVLTPGGLVFWSLLHRGRIGVESLELLLGTREAPVSLGMITSPNDKWTSYSGIYRVGEAETVTRFALASRSGTSEGNLVDGAVLAPIELGE